MRESKVERMARRAREEQTFAENAAKYKLTIPARLLAAQALAKTLILHTDITLVESGPSVRFYDPYDISKFDETVTYETEEWELVCLERQLQERREERDARERRRGIAEDAWNTKLTREEKIAIKEFIHHLHT